MVVIKTQALAIYITYLNTYLYFVTFPVALNFSFISHMNKLLITDYTKNTKTPKNISGRQSMTKQGKYFPIQTYSDAKE